MVGKGKKPGGRPSSFTQDLAEAICNEIADGKSLRVICESESMPNRETVRRWLAQDEQFRGQYAQAREEQADVLFEEILEIADDGRNDWMERRDAEDANLGWRENGEALRRSALRVDARKWMAGKLRPKRYGEKIIQELQGKDGGAIETETRIIFVDARPSGS